MTLESLKQRRQGESSQHSYPVFVDADVAMFPFGADLRQPLSVMAEERILLMCAVVGAWEGTIGSMIQRKVSPSHMYP